MSTGPGIGKGQIHVLTQPLSHCNGKKSLAILICKLEQHHYLKDGRITRHDAVSSNLCPSHILLGLSFTELTHLFFTYTMESCL